MPELLANEIVKIASFVPGLVGLANADITTIPKPLDEADWAKGIIIEDSPQGLKIGVSILVNSEVRAKAIVNELTQSIKSVLKKQKAKLNSIVVSIRGVE